MSERMPAGYDRWRTEEPEEPDFDDLTDAELREIKADEEYHRLADEGRI